MNKLRAIKMLGGTQARAAEKLGVSRQAVHKWPDPIPESVRLKIKRYQGGERFERIPRCKLKTLLTEEQK